MNDEIRLHKQNRINGKSASKAKFWCPNCDGALVGEYGVCPHCHKRSGKIDSGKKRFQ
jgi:Zn finger protein HypA/HybF involved in hydrogenase expression